jgi:DNA repair exonuclease SbcCD ATPase subunit
MAEVGRYSTGQLRRVDLALLLARRQVLAASDRNRLALPYLVIDEALNGLDDEGLDGIAALLVEEAKDNLVIVLSHDEKMSRGIPFDQHIQLGAQT